MMKIFDDYYINSNNTDIRNDIIFPDCIKKYNLFDIVRINNGPLLINKTEESNYLIDIDLKDGWYGINIESKDESNIVLKTNIGDSYTEIVKYHDNVLDIYYNNEPIISIYENETYINNILIGSTIKCSNFYINNTSIFDLFLSNDATQNKLDLILNESKQYTNISMQNLTYYINTNYYNKSEINNLYNELDTILRQYTDNQIYINLLNYYTKQEVDNLFNNNYINIINYIDNLKINYYTKTEINTLLNSTFSGLISTMDQKIQDTKNWVSTNFFNKYTGDKIYSDSILESNTKFFFGDIGENNSTIFLERKNGSISDVGFFDITFDSNSNWASSLSKFRILELNKTSESFSVEVSTGDTYIDGNLFVNKNTDVNGNLKVFGNLDILGSLTNIDTSNLIIEDNLIELNKNETGNGVTLNESGILINRGNLIDVKFVFDELNDVFVGKDINNNYYRLITNTPINNYDCVNLLYANQTYVNVSGDTINGNLIINGSLTVSDVVNFNNNLNVSGNEQINGNLTVNQNVNLKGNVTIGTNTSNNHTINGNFQQNGNQIVNGNINVNGNETISNNLQINNNITVDNDALVKRNVNINGNLILGTNNSNNHIINGDINVNDNLNVSKITTMNDNLYVNSSFVDLNTDQLEIKDNIIKLNSKESNNGVTNRFSGIEINRGSLQKSQFVFDEQTDRFKHLINNNVSHITVPLQPVNNDDAVSKQYISDTFNTNFPINGLSGQIFYIKQDNNNQTETDFILKKGIFVTTTNELNNAFNYSDHNNYIGDITNNVVYEYNNVTNNWVISPLTLNQIWGLGRLIYNDKTNELLFRTNTDNIKITTTKKYREEFSLSPMSNYTIQFSNYFGGLNGLDISVNLRVKDTTVGSPTYNYYVDYEQFFMGQNLTFDDYDLFNHDINVLLNYDTSIKPRVYYALNETEIKIFNNTDNQLYFSILLVA